MANAHPNDLCSHAAIRSNQAAHDQLDMIQISRSFIKKAKKRKVDWKPACLVHADHLVHMPLQEFLLRVFRLKEQRIAALEWWFEISHDLSYFRLYRTDTPT